MEIYISIVEKYTSIWKSQSPYGKSLIHMETAESIWKKAKSIWKKAKSIWKKAKSIVGFKAGKLSESQLYTQDLRVTARG